MSSVSNCTEGEQFWKVTNEGHKNCPNMHFFRLLKEVDFKIASKRVLDIGFGHGEDMLEMQRRGCSELYGIDINADRIPFMATRLNLHLDHFHCLSVGREPFSFVSGQFDLIYSLNMIYYLTDDQLFFFFKQCACNLSCNGLFVVSIILRDYETVNGEMKPMETHFSNPNNPIKFLSKEGVTNMAERAGFVVEGSKWLMESYSKDERYFREEAFLCYRLVD
ncbi:MAG: class I SAM-dependent methyltransferase [Pseudodesulfovibrio sp.]